MKLSALALLTLLSFQASASEAWNCILTDEVYSKSPVAKVETTTIKGKTTTTLEIVKSPSDWKTLLKTEVTDNSEDVLALFENESKGITLSFYMDEADEMGMAEGHITSSVMNGSVRCNFVK